MIRFLYSDQFQRLSSLIPDTLEAFAADSSGIVGVGGQPQAGSASGGRDSRLPAALPRALFNAGKQQSGKDYDDCDNDQ